jgi:hypothetical protein
MDHAHPKIVKIREETFSLKMKFLQVFRHMQKIDLNVRHCIVTKRKCLNMEKNPPKISMFLITQKR